MTNETARRLKEFRRERHLEKKWKNKRTVNTTALGNRTRESRNQNGFFRIVPLSHLVQRTHALSPAVTLDLYSPNTYNARDVGWPAAVLCRLDLILSSLLRSLKMWFFVPNIHTLLIPVA